MCFYKRGLRAAILWRDRPEFGRFDTSPAKKGKTLPNGTVLLVSKSVGRSKFRIQSYRMPI
jgi:hypothetical protein